MDRNGASRMSQVRTALLSISLLLCALVSGCRVDESQLYGVYLAEYESGTEKLTLEGSGRFVQEVLVKGTEKPIMNAGVWRYYPALNRVDLEGCLGVGDGFGNIRPDFAVNRGGCSFPVERRWLFIGRLRLGPDEAAALQKVE